MNCQDIVAANPGLSAVLVVLGFLARHFGPLLLAYLQGRQVPVVPGPAPVTPVTPSSHPLLDLLALILKSIPAGKAQDQAVEAVVGQLSAERSAKA